MVAIWNEVLPQRNAEEVPCLKTKWGGNWRKQNSSTTVSYCWWSSRQGVSTSAASTALNAEKGSQPVPSENRRSENSSQKWYWRETRKGLHVASQDIWFCPKRPLKHLVHAKGSPRYLVLSKMSILKKTSLGSNSPWQLLFLLVYRIKT